MLGFVQQGQELRNSGRALWLQGEELKNSVEQQRELVAATREQLSFESDRLARETAEARRRAQPRFEVAYNGWTGGDVHGRAETHWTLVNHGSRCTSLVVLIDGVQRHSQAQLQSGESIGFRALMGYEEAEYMFRLEYLDGNQEAGFRLFTAKGNPEGFVAQEVVDDGSYV